MTEAKYEQQRLKALYSFHILDTESESHFDQLLKLVSSRFSVPMCFINLVDEDRFWFKASYGAEVQELCRSPGFCETTVEKKLFYEIPNALEEPSVSSTDWVLGEVAVRYYAGTPLFTEQGFVIGTLCMFDVRPRKFTQSDVDDLDAFAVMVMRLIELNKLKVQQLRSKNMESIGRLTGGVAHDFNNQLSGITSALDLLVLEPGLSEQSTDLIQSIKGCTQVSSDLIGKLLNLSRSRSYDKKLFDLHDLLNDLFSLMERTIGSSIELKLELNARHSVCLGDRSQIHSSLLNILVNSKDAMPEGGQIIIRSEDSNEDEIQFDKLPVGQYTVVKIIDNGSGIPRQDLDKVFEPFYTTKISENGTGLGLPSALQVVKHHGGTILIETSSAGTTSSIFLPKTPSDLPESGSSEKISTFKSKSKRVLLAEDEDVLRRLYCLLLQKLGFEVEVFCDGKEALDALMKDREFDILVTDIKMPRLDGFQLYQAVEEFLPNLPVILISGFADREKVDLLCKQSNVGFLQKPFTDSELSKVLETHLGDSVLG